MAHFPVVSCRYSLVTYLSKDRTEIPEYIILTQIIGRVESVGA